MIPVCGKHYYYPKVLGNPGDFRYWRDFPITCILVFEDTKHVFQVNVYSMIKRLAFGTLCLGFAALGHADTVLFTLDGNFATPDYAFYSYTSTSNQAENNVPVGPYITYLNGGAYNNLLAYTFCYDFNSPTNVGTQYPGSFQAVPDPSAPNYTADLEATYLINKLNALGLTTAPLAIKGAISLAIWEIMNPSSTTSLTQFPTDPAAVPYESEAFEAVTSGSWNAADAAVYPMWVPNDPSVQRFGTVFAGQSPVPEPSTLGLMGLAVVALAVLGRRTKSSTPKA